MTDQIHCPVGTISHAGVTVVYRYVLLATELGTDKPLPLTSDLLAAIEADQRRLLLKRGSVSPAKPAGIEGGKAPSHESLYLRAELARRAAAEATQPPWQAVAIQHAGSRISEGVSIMRETPEGLTEELIVMPGDDPQDSVDGHFIAAHHDHIELINELEAALRASEKAGAAHRTAALQGQLGG